jgi:hypothetical protein
MQPNTERGYTQERFVIITDVIQSSAITSEYLFWGSDQCEVSDIANAAFFSTQNIAQNQIIFLKANTRFINSFIMPITSQTQVTHYPNWFSAWKLLREKGEA